MLSYPHGCTMLHWGLRCTRSRCASSSCRHILIAIVRILRTISVRAGVLASRLGGQVTSWVAGCGGGWLRGN